MSINRPTLVDFAHTPIEQLHALMPDTVFYTPGGTRRQAALAGIDPHSEQYPPWSRARMVDSLDVLCRFGAKHVFTGMVRSSQIAEVGRYRERLLAWLHTGLAGEEALATWQSRNWRVRLVGIQAVPELHDTAARLEESTPSHWQHTIWFTINSSLSQTWEHVLSLALTYGVRDQGALIRAMYGEDIPLAQLWLSFGKLLFAPDALPIVVAGEVQCYWSQRPGYSLDDAMMRDILYDYAYLRRTWTEDKSKRYIDIDQQRARWQRSLVVGVGQDVGGFWYPRTQGNE
jgi:hypothetical protein